MRIDSYQDLPEGIVNQDERLFQLLVVVFESVPGYHEPEGIEHRDVECRVHHHRAALAHLLQMIDEFLSLLSQLFSQNRLTYAVRSQISHREFTTLRPRSALGEQNALNDKCTLK